MRDIRSPLQTGSKEIDAVVLEIANPRSLLLLYRDGLKRSSCSSEADALMTIRVAFWKVRRSCVTVGESSNA